MTRSRCWRSAGSSARPLIPRRSCDRSNAHDHRGRRPRSSPKPEDAGEAVVRRHLAAMKLIVDEPNHAHWTNAFASDRRFVASWLLHTELHCASGHHPREIPLASIHAVLNTMNVVDLTRGDMLAAGTHAPLRSNDAIPLAVAIRLGTDESATYKVSSQTLR